MVYPLLLLLIGAAFAVSALVGGGLWLVLLWPAAAFGSVVFAGYAMRRPSILGKRGDGSVSTGARLFFLPFLLFSQLAWWVYRHATREDACNEIVPGMWLGRWPGRADMPDGIDVVVDITAELPARPGVRDGRRYLCLPTLDGSVPDEASFTAMVDRLEHEPGALFVHCAFGHGRSAMLVAVLLLRRGLARDAAEAESMLKARRPKVSMSPRQREYILRAASAAGGERG